MEKFKTYIKNFICKYFGHDFVFNFPINSYPSKCICKRCKTKYKRKFGSDLFSDNPNWLMIDKFENETRSDDELIEKWF